MKEFFQNKYKKVTILKILNVFLFFILIFNCSKKEEIIEPIDKIVKPSNWFFIGILPTPNEGQNFDSVYKYVSSFNHLVPVWGKPTPFYNMFDDLNGWWGDYFIGELIRGNNMAPIIHFNFYDKEVNLLSPPGIQNPTLRNIEWREAYKKEIVDVVKVIKPKYISLGNEVNRWLLVHGSDGDNGFNEWISLYEEIYDTIKTISQKTIVFCTFAREIQSEHREANMNFLSSFDKEKIDVVALTSYPFSVQGINSPSDIPSDYYTKVFNYIQGKPIGFTEIAWWSRLSFGGEEAQSLFIHSIPEMLDGMEVEFVMWPWLCDIDSTDSIGLIKRDGSEKKGFSEWKNLYKTE